MRKNERYEEWIKRSKSSILLEHPLWYNVDTENFHKKIFLSENLFETIHVSIYRYDPMGIGHLSVDEYSPEITSIAILIDKYLNEKLDMQNIFYDDILKIVKDVFTDYFGELDKFTLNGCELASKDIYEDIKKEMKKWC